MILHFIRHGKSTNNKVNDDQKNCNSSLVEKGVLQALSLQKTWDNKCNIDLIITSPLARALETTECIFGKITDIPVIVSDLMLEYPQSNYIPNLRKSKSELMLKYPLYDFDIFEEPTIFKENETKKELNDRIYSFRLFLSTRTESNIAIIGHNSFFKEFLNISEDILHCKPYTV